MREKVILPDKEAVLKAAQVGQSSIEGAEYVAQQYEKRVIAARKEQEAGVVFGVLADYVQQVKYTLGEQEGAWSGVERIPTSYKNLNQNMAASVSGRLGSQIDGDVTLNIAFNDQSELVRGYMVGGDPASPDAVSSLDIMFNSWLAQNADIVNKSSTLYEANEKGEMKMDAHGKPVKADVDQVKELINDQEKGFGKFVEDHLKAKGSEQKLTVAVQEYPQANEQEVQRTKKPAEANAPEMTEDLSLDENTEPNQGRSQQL